MFWNYYEFSFRFNATQKKYILESVYRKISCAYYYQYCIWYKKDHFMSFDVRSPMDPANSQKYCWQMRTKLFLSRPVIVITWSIDTKVNLVRDFFCRSIKSSCFRGKKSTNLELIIWQRLLQDMFTPILHITLK